MMTEFTKITRFIYKIERIKVGANMRLSTLDKICKYLKCQPDDILNIK